MARSNFIVRGGADFSAITNAFRHTQKQADGFKDKLEKSFKKTKGEASGFEQNFGLAIKKVGVLLGKVLTVKKIIDFGKESVAAYNDISVSMSKLSKVMQNTMGATSKQVDGIKSLINAQERLGVVSSEAQAAGAQELATYLTSEKSLRTLLPILNDMAAQQYGVEASAQAVTTIATMMGKVMNGQVGGLSRYGYSFTKAQEQILKFGDEEQRAAVLAEVVSESVGGMNKALAQTPTWQLKQVQSTLSSIKTAVGSGIVAMLKSLLPYLTALADEALRVAQSFDRMMQSVFGKNLDITTGQISAATDSMDGYGDAIESAGKKAKGALGGFDEINQLADNSEESPVFDIGMAAAGGGVAEVQEPDVAWIDNVKSKLESLRNLLAAKFAPTVTAFKSGFEKLKAPVKSAVDNIQSTMTGLWKNTLAPLGMYLLGDFVPGMVNGFGTTLALIFTDVMAFAVSQFGKEFAFVCEQIRNLTNDIIVPVMQLLQTVTSDALTSVRNMWAQSGQSILDKLSKLFDRVHQIWNNIYDSVIKPIVENIINKVNEIWSMSLKPLWDNLVKFFASITEAVLAVWNNALAPFVNVIIGVIAPSIVNAFNVIVDVVSTFIRIVADVVSGVLKILRGLLDFITGVFTGDWKRAWEGIKTFFIGIWDAIWGVLKGIINLIIDGLNILWRAVYSVVAGIVNGIGGIAGFIGEIVGKDWSFKMPSAPPVIPKLASGGLAFGPTLAQVGEYAGARSNPEVIAPLDTLKSLLAEVVGGDITLNNYVTLEDGTLVGRTTKTISRQSRLTGAAVLG